MLDKANTTECNKKIQKYKELKNEIEDLTNFTGSLCTEIVNTDCCNGCKRTIFCKVRNDYFGIDPCNCIEYLAKSIFEINKKLENIIGKEEKSEFKNI